MRPNVAPFRIGIDVHFHAATTRLVAARSGTFTLTSTAMEMGSGTTSTASDQRRPTDSVGRAKQHGPAGMEMGQWKWGQAPLPPLPINAAQPTPSVRLEMGQAPLPINAAQPRPVAIKN
jgi:hypothetical protein